MLEHVTLKIGAFVLDPSRNLLIGAEGDTALEPKMVDVLMVLADQPGTVISRDTLINTVWKTEFGADERLTRAISLLRKAFGDERGAAARYIETVSKRGYRLVASVERLAEGSGVPDTPAPESKPSVSPVGDGARAPRPWRTWQAITAAAAVAALTIAGIAATVWPRSSAPASVYAQDVVELRPFAVIDSKPATDTFARQAEASVKRILASNQVLVAEAGAARETAGSNESEFILSGTIEQTGDRYGVTLFFDSRSDGQTVWSQRFMRPAAEAEELREQIGVNAAHIIGCGLKRRADARVKPGLAAFKIYVETCDPEYAWSGESKLLAAAKRLTDIAPDDAYGNALLAMAYSAVAGKPDLGKIEADAYRAESQRALDRAISLDPANLFVRYARANTVSRREALLGDAALIDHPLVRASELWMNRSTGRLRDGLQSAERSVALSPLSAASRSFQATIHMQAGNPEAADRILENTLKAWPDFSPAQFYRFVNAAFYGNADTALALLGPLAKNKDYTPEDTGCWKAFIAARARGGTLLDRKAIRSACHSREVDDSGRDYSARMLAALGDVDGAYEVLRGKVWDWDGSTIFLFYPEMARLRADARFMPFIAPSGLLEYWTKSNRWPDFCSDETLPYNCKEAAARALKGNAGVRPKAGN